MKRIFYSTILLAAVLLCSCSKNDTSTSTVDQQAAKAYFEGNMTNQDLIVTSATDSGMVNITSSFSGYTIHLTDSAALSGTVGVTTDLKAAGGFWNIDEGYNKITFNLPVLNLPRLTFFNRQWTIVSRGGTTTNLVPTDGYNLTLALSKK